LQGRKFFEGFAQVRESCVADCITTTQGLIQKSLHKKNMSKEFFSVSKVFSKFSIKDFFLDFHKEIFL